jgi:UDP-4-amino-4-deoxy-L-arabinose formyltransferase/UDP-glucuronic acid dehydrogenase (UDP-4-keto-hexauronic acid decarboxylating)
MTAGIDAGPIAYQAEFPLDDRDTGLSVALECARAGLPLVERLVETAAHDPGAIPALPQDLTRREYFGREIPRGGALVWSEPAAAVVAFVRAFDYHPFPSPWGTPRTRCADREIGVIKAERTGLPTAGPAGVLRREGADSLQVAAADEWVALTLLRLGDRDVRPRDVLEVLAPGCRLENGDRGGSR